MEIPVEYQVLIGTAVGGLILFIVRSIRDYLRETRGESQRMAIISIILGVLIIIPFISVIGLILAIISYTKKKNKALSKIAIAVNIAGMLPWLAVLIFGP